MVLTRKVGMRRSFPLVVFLYAATFGLYGIYWHHKAQSEVFRQFELDREDLDEGTVWLLFAYAVFRPLLWVFLYVFLENLQHVRRRLGLRERPGTAGFLVLVVLGQVLLGGALGTLYGAILVLPEDTGEPVPDLVGVLLAVAVLLALVAAPLLLSAYGGLQGSLNEVWDAYDARMAELIPPAGSGRSVPAGAGGRSDPGPSGWASVR